MTKPTSVKAVFVPLLFLISLWMLATTPPAQASGLVFAGTPATDALQICAGPQRDSASADRALPETLRYEEPGELSLIGPAIREFFVAEDGVVLAEDAAGIVRLALMIDGRDIDQMQWQSLSSDGRWSEPAELDITWQEAEAVVARVDPESQSSAIRLIANTAQIDFIQIEQLAERPASTLLARELPLEVESDHRAELRNTPPNMITRAQWGARNTGLCGSLHNPTHLTLHHTATPNNDTISAAARMRQMQAFHIDNRGWCDFGYHFTVGIDGNLYQGRITPARTGAHVGGHNSNNVGVSVVGNFTSFTPRQSQLARTESVSRWIVEEFNIPVLRSRIRGHRDWPGHTTNSCPGNQFYPWLDTLVQLLGNSPCQSECQLGARRCGSNGNPELCVNDGAGCGVWQQQAACECGDVCSGGSCVTDPEICCTNPVSNPSTTFADLVAGSRQAQAAERLFELNITQGCQATPQRLFCPDCPTRRWQAASFLASSLNLPGAPANPPTFSDVPADAPYAGAIEALFAAGLISGCGNGEFCPEQFISRAQTGALLAAASSRTIVAYEEPRFTDLPSGHWARPAVETLYRHCMIDSCADDPSRFCPDSNATRIDFGVILTDSQNLLQLSEPANCCRPGIVADADAVFADMKQGTDRALAARILRDEGITQGCSSEPSLFCGSCTLPRAEAASLLFNALDMEASTPASPTFADVPVDHPHFAAIETLAAANLVSGCGAGLFCPDRVLRRSEAASLLANAIGLTPEDAPSSSAYTDVAESDWFSWPVNALEQSCILEACSANENRFCPDTGILREDFALFLTRAFELGEIGQQRCLPRSGSIFLDQFREEQTR